MSLLIYCRFTHLYLKLLKYLLILICACTFVLGLLDCEGLEDSDAKKCCTRADYEISLDAKHMMEDLDRNLGPGDVMFAEVARECLVKKRDLAAGPCANFDYRHNEAVCSTPPFSYERSLVREGILSVPDPPPPEYISEECRQERYLLWTRNSHDFVAGHSHKGYSFKCALWDALSLNRTLVIDSFTAMNKIHTGWDIIVDVPYTAWYGLYPLKNLPRGGLLWFEFERRCGALGVLSEARNEIVIMPPDASQKEMLAHSDVPLLVRGWDMGLDSSISYGYMVCNRPDVAERDNPTFVKEPGVDYNLPDPFKWPKYARWVHEVADEVIKLLEKEGENGTYDIPICLHVRRGDKVTQMKKRYPNLDEETSPANILRVLEPYLRPGSTVYIATNELKPKEFFKPLESTYKVLSLANLPPSVFDSSQFLSSSLALVDYTVLSKCKRMIPTFSSEEARGFDSHISLSRSPK